MRALMIALSLLAMLVSVNSAKADRRIAFVAGNGAYKNIQRLPNAPISAKAMTSFLQGVGFEVVEAIDLTRDEMTQRLLEFGGKAQGADVAVFYYSGHAISIGGSEFLLPTDADIKSEMDVKLGSAINFQVTLDQTMSAAKVRLVFLDASRDNPFSTMIASKRSSGVSVKLGLAEMKSDEGTVVAFATGPGGTAPDGPKGTIRPFTRALITHIAVPGVEIQQAMTEVRAQVSDETDRKQMPWGHSNLVGAVYLNSTVAPASAPASPPASTK
jgi:uncharacterized caspase-like protein